MRTLMSIVFLVLVATGCSKKSEPAPKRDPAAKSAEQAEGSDTTAPTPTETAAGSAEPVAAAGELPPLSDVPAIAPKECGDAHAQMKKLHACEKLDAKMKITMVRAWNDAVTGSFAVYDKASDDNKRTIKEQCAKMAQTTPLLLGSCK